jgi:hypothetical protein
MAEEVKLALIPPVDLLEWTSETTTQLMLPHMLSNPQYEYTYKMHCKDPSQYVILDNGAAESEQVTAWDLIEIATKYQVDELVIPDVIGNCEATYEMKEAFFRSMKELGYTMGNLGAIEFQYVIQGNSLEDFKQSARDAIEDDRIDVIAIPRHALAVVSGRNGQRRKQLALWIAERTGKPIHLLGGSPYFPCELRDNGKWPSTVRSHDTSAPFNFAFEGKHLRNGNVVKRPPKYFERPADDFDAEYVFKNVNYLKEWTGDF